MVVEDIERIRTDLYSFYKYYVASTFKENLHARHIDVLSAKLLELYRGDFHRLCVAMPPRHSKSSLVTEAFPLWLIFHDPSLNILIVNNSAALSEKFGIALRELVKKYGYEFNLLLSEVKSASTYLMFTDLKGELYPGSIRLVGAGGSITGQDVDMLIIDDPYEGFNDITPGLLEKKIVWFKTIIEQRIEPHTRLILLHTRWNSNDLQGYLMENEAEDYEFISFPALYPDGEPLWPERYTKSELLKKKESLGERLFNAIYQQKPLDDTGDFFNLSKIKWGLPQDDSNILDTCRAWDIASATNNSNDYTVGVKIIKTLNGDYIVSDIVRGKFGDENKKIIQKTARIDTVNTVIVIETGVAAAGKLLFQEWEEQLPGFILEQAIPIHSKVDRATPFKNAILDAKVYFNISDSRVRDAILGEFKSFPEGKHDDIVDAASYAYNYLAHDEENDYTPGFKVIKL